MTIENYETFLKAMGGHRLFNGMDEDTLKHTIQCLKPQIIRYQSADVIAIGGTPFKGVGLVLKGQVILTKENVSGSRHLMAKLGPSQMFGEMIAFGGGLPKVWPATIEALGDCDIMFLPPNMILGTCTHVCKGHNQLIHNMLAIISDKALALNRKVEYLSMKGMREKLATFLLEHHRKTGQMMFEIPLSREEMAGFLNVSRPSMSRELSRMKDEGLIDYYQGSFKLLDFEGLVACVQ